VYPLYSLEQSVGPPSLKTTLLEPIPGVESPVEVAGFRGTLDEIGLPSILCILEMERKTGVLVLILEPALEKAYLYLREGRVLRAQLSRRKEPRNAAVVYSLLSCTHGTFDFLPSEVVPDDDIQCSITRLIVEGARRMGEASSRPSLGFFLDERLRIRGEGAFDLEERAPLPSPPASPQGKPDEAASVDRSDAERERDLERTSPQKTAPAISRWMGPEQRKAVSPFSHRWAFAKGAVSGLLVAGFVLVVLSAILCLDPGLPVSPGVGTAGHRASPQPPLPDAEGRAPCVRPARQASGAP
jgi:hypothetical protein